MSNPYFPRWRKVQGGSGLVVQPDECMSWPQNIAMGAQLDAVNEFEDLAVEPDDAPTALVPLGAAATVGA